MEKISFFRKKYPKFVYRNYFYRISKNNLEIFFDFKIEPDIYFKPKIIIENVDKKRIEKMGNGVLNNLIFHLGLMEIPSYWKATCSPEIEIRAGHLNKKQINWWKNLIMNGMGQFFYENRIDFTAPDFLNIQISSILINYPMVELTSIEEIDRKETNRKETNRKKVLAAVGGGKDSIVALELLKKGRGEIRCFSLNPTPAAKKIMGLAGCKKPIIVERKIDKRLLELNRRGYLNGHTPFSAYLAFLSILLAEIFGCQFVAFSNERSANEGNVKYLGKTINHQWSKSFEFEESFRDYVKKYLAKNIEYFSFLRPFYEIQIAKIFSRHSPYFKSFLSCNEARKTNSGRKKPAGKWCGNCPKCLFVFAILYPFLQEKILIQIFGQDLFDKKDLLPVMLELIGVRKFKPLECVGTKRESLIAFYLSWKKYGGQTLVKLPYLLRYFQNKILSRTKPKVLVRGLPKYPYLERESEKIINSWDERNNLPKDFKKALISSRRA